MKLEASSLKKNSLAAAISTVIAPMIGFAPVASQAQLTDPTEVVIVTATRRADTVQDIPINITAIGSQQLRDQRLVGLDEISRLVPGLQILNLGPRDEVTNIIVRGLNTSAIGPTFVSDTVATYLGEIPLPVDLKTNDLERVEVLIGPQGTLYGSGTLGGAIRYIPKQPSFEGFEAEVRSNLFALNHSDGFGADVGLTVNVPLVDNVLSFRASADFIEDPGYIDYNHIVREAGISNPQPDLSDPAEVAANLRRVEDANGEQTLSGRLALRWSPSETLDATLWYYYQNVHAEGRSLTQVDSFSTGRYESGQRFEEPNNIRNDLVSLEIKADLGFAELTSATGVSNYVDRGQRDQTDLLLNFEYYYELFPSFSAFTRERNTIETLTQEIRLVSTGASRLSWIAGLYYSDLDQYATSEEFTPGFDEFALNDPFLGGVALRPDSLEYFSIFDDTITESAFYGELSYDISDTWQVTLGLRAYDFEETLTGGFALPLFDTIYLDEPADAINIDLQTNSTGDDGTLYKINLAHNFSNDALAYLTISEGYRIGGLNSVSACTQADLTGPGQALCALPNEVLIKADTTTNYELGMHSTWLDGRLTLNAAVYHIDWKDLQVDDVTLNGSLPITSNGGAADSDGLEVSARFGIGSNWQMTGTYSYNKAELAEGSSQILGGRETGPLFTPAGSRLPGSPAHQASLGFSYSTSVRSGRQLAVNYGIMYMGDILDSIGATEEPSVLPWRGEKLPSYSLHQVSVKLSDDRWDAAFYIDNLWDEYAITGTRDTRRLLEPYRMYSQVPSNTNGFLLRGYAQYVARPRTAGLSLTYRF